MKAFAPIFLIFCFFSTQLYSQKGVKDSCTPPVPIVVDGNVNEWEVNWVLEGKFLYNICNDNENLYVRVKVADDLIQKKIAYYGMFIKLDPSGKKKRRLGVKYPVGKDEREIKFEKHAPNLNDLDVPDRIALKQEWIRDVEVLELCGLAKDNIVSSRLGLMNGIQVAIVTDEAGAYIYECKIPFKSFRINKAETPVLGVTIETGKMATAVNNTNRAAPVNTSRPGYGQMSTYRYNEMTVPNYMWVGVKLN